jgi:hypothetical protein
MKKVVETSFTLADAPVRLEAFAGLGLPVMNPAYINLALPCWGCGSRRHVHAVFLACCCYQKARDANPGYGINSATESALFARVNTRSARK